MKFVQIKDDNYVNIENISFVYLFKTVIGDIKIIYWVFKTSTSELKSDFFETEENAKKWFDENIAPIMFNK